MNVVNQISLWVLKFVYLNFLLIGFTIIGLIVFGLFPSYVATLTIVRHWILGKRDIPMFVEFWKTYKKEFYKSNIIGLLLVLFGYTIYLNFLFIFNIENDLLFFIYVPNLTMFLIYYCFVIYIFPFYVHFDIKLKDVIKNSLFLIFSSPFYSIMLLISSGVLFLILYIFPGFTLFIGGSLYACYLMFVTKLNFERLLNKKSNLNYK